MRKLIHLLISFVLVLLITSFKPMPENRQYITDGPVYKVMKQLLLSMGYTGDDAPAIFLELGGSDGSGFSYLKETNEIRFDKAFYKLILESDLYYQGAFNDVIAFYIGHELGHFRDNRACDGIFMANPTPGCSISVDKHIQTEITCDHFGGFAAHRAGFQTPKIIEQIFNLFQEYNDQAPGMDMRRLEARELTNRIDRLIRVFDEANELLKNGDYYNAQLRYQDILQEYNGVEVINNSCVASLYEVLLYGDLDKKLKWPFSIDFYSKLRSNVGAPFAGANDARKEILDSVIQSLEGVLDRTHNAYPYAWINLGIAQALYGGYDIAVPLDRINYAKSITRHPDFRKNYQEALMAEANIYKLYKQNDKAKYIYENMLVSEFEDIRAMANNNLKYINFY